MRVLWISSLAWNENGYMYPVDGPGAVSGSLFQQQLITGLRELNVEVDIIADYPYAERDNRKDWSQLLKINSDYYVIPTVASKAKERMIKSQWIEKRIKKQFKMKKYDIVIAYLIHTPYMNALRIAKNMGVKTVLICPDLPDMMDMSLKSKLVKKNLKKIDMSLQRHLYSYIDGYVLFTQYMIERIPVGNKPYEVIEGVASIDHLSTQSVEKENAVMYAGTLHKNIGIEQILQAIKLINTPNMNLWIFGDGDLKEDILEAARKDKRIIFKGFVDRNTLFEYEKKAIALINARNPNDDFTKYSFPSKTFEYLYSGTTFISTRLLGVPKEYDDYIYYIDDNDPKSIASAIDDVYNNCVSMSTYDVREFIIREKSRIKQAKKLLNLFDKLV